jgi:hypothetical protein
MKLRLSDNALRLRLLPQDLAALSRGGELREAIAFGAGDHEVLRVALICSPDAASIHARLDGKAITVFVPQEHAMAWLSGPEEGMEAVQDIGGGAGLRILIEKDRGRR